MDVYKGTIDKKDAAKSFKNNNEAFLYLKYIIVNLSPSDAEVSIFIGGVLVAPPQTIQAKKGITDEGLIILSKEDFKIETNHSISYYITMTEQK